MKKIALISFGLLATLLMAGCPTSNTPVRVDEKALTVFGFSIENNPRLSGNVDGTINERSKTIELIVPSRINVTKLIATFVTTGKSVTVGGITQISGKTFNNFTKGVPYTVTAKNGSFQVYTVMVTRLSDEKTLTMFSFLKNDNTDLAENVTGTIHGTDIILAVPFNTEVTDLKATFLTTGNSVTVDDIIQISGKTPNNFAGPQHYIVTADNGTFRIYTVTVKRVTAVESTMFHREGIQAGNIGDLTLTKSKESLKMIYANDQVSLTVPAGVDDKGTATLTHKFWMGETEVTNALFVAVYQWAYDNEKFHTTKITKATKQSPNLLNKNTARHGGQELIDLDAPNVRVTYDDSGGFSVTSKTYKEYPVSNVSWYGAVMFCNWLTEMRDGATDNVVYSNIDTNWKHYETKEDKNKNGYRLPSSMEWEYAARYRGTDTENTVSGHTTPRYTKGDSASGAATNKASDTGKVAVYDKTSSKKVKSLLRPNALGIHDMSGNIGEWCFTAPHRAARVIRGGSWADTKKDLLQVGSIRNVRADLMVPYIGFRLCRTAD